MSILIATPCYGGMASTQYLRSCLALQEEFQRAGVDHDWLLMENESLIQRARNNICRSFLADTPLEKLLFIDADIEFRPEHVAALWNLQAEVAVGIYAMKKPDQDVYAAWVNGQLVKELDGLPVPVNLDFAGTGFMMIDRSALLKMRAAWPEREHVEAGPHAGELAQSFEWFSPRVIQDETGNWYASEDYAFCYDWRSLGGEVVCDPWVRLIHHGSYAYGR